MAENPVETLNENHRRFVLEYLLDRNATAAAIRAGYSPRSAKQYAHELMQSEAIKEAIEIAIEQRNARLKVDTDNVVLAALEIRDRCMQRRPVMTKDGKEWVQLTNEEGEGVWQFDAKGANAANALLAKHVGGFIDRKEIAIPQGTGVLAVPVPPSADQWAAGAKAQQAALTDKPEPEQ